jgi:transposase-like protein
MNGMCSILKEQKTEIEWGSNQKKYSPEKKERAVGYYLEHGCNLSRTIRKPGYPSQEHLAAWIDELKLGTRKTRMVLYRCRMSGRGMR